MADDTMSPDALAGITAATESLTQSSHQAAQNMGNIQTAVGSIGEYLTNVTTSISEFEKLSDSISSTMESLVGDYQKLVEVQEKELDLRKKINKERDKETAKLKKQANFWKKMEKGIGGATKKAYSGVKSTAAQVTGMTIGLGTIVSLLIEAYNNMRRVRAMASQTASHFEDGQKSIGSARNSIMQLRRGFRTSYEEAGNVVNALAQMGMSAKEIESGPGFKAGKFKLLGPEEVKLSKEAAGYLEASVKFRAHAEKLAKKGNEAAFAYNTVAEDQAETGHKKQIQYVDEVNKKRRAEFAKTEEIRRKSYKKTYGAAEELYAIEKQYGISIQQSGSFVKRMEQDFGKLNEEGRTMLGVAIKTAAELDNIGISELIGDWEQLITKAQTYKTDVMGILGLYNQMMRKEGLMGIEAPTSVKKSIVSDVAGWTANLDFGWKAKLGKGSSVTERAFEFEDASAGEKLKRALAMIQEEAQGPTESIRKTKARALSAQLFTEKDTQKYLADLVVSGKVNEKAAEEGLKKLAEEQERIEKNEKLWRTDRGTLITKAKETARGLQTIQELIKKWAVDFMAQYVKPVLNWLGEIYTAVTELWQDTDKRVLAQETAKTKMASQGMLTGRDIQQIVSGTVTENLQFGGNRIGAYTEGALSRGEDPRSMAVKFLKDAVGEKSFKDILAEQNRAYRYGVGGAQIRKALGTKEGRELQRRAGTMSHEEYVANVMQIVRDTKRAGVRPATRSRGVIGAGTTAAVSQNR